MTRGGSVFARPGVIRNHKSGRSSQPKGAATQHLYTLGYEKRTLPEYLTILRQHRIDVVIDVRDVAWSHKPGFSEKPLQQGLERAGIEYVRAGFVGNPKWLRAEAKDLDEMLEFYRWYLKEFSEVVDGFRQMVKELSDRGLRICLTCFERNPAECHRSILLNTAGFRRVEHL
jgi:uncharacterized protein (DUF488 family)